MYEAGIIELGNSPRTAQVVLAHKPVGPIRVHVNYT